ncbi:hypothetical protein CVT25_005785 [Psilocybe cyanescens]|uniref:Proteasome activator PA28 C-terminal domain-containing protein n=1 Tax=Psilocybe cyanescens TaxID=93625 RepID=A0A409VLN5_PSICY|nr:hypothetical protein CVT25_005785 [Psilocybe cyanescens]
MEYRRKKRKISEVCASREDNGNLAVVDVNESALDSGNSSNCARNLLDRRELDVILKKECDDLVQLMVCDDFDILTEFHRAQESALNIRDVTRKYHLARAKVCSKLIKYPSVEDYKYALKEYDEQQLYLARQHLRDIRNIYVVLNDMIKRGLTIEI